MICTPPKAFGTPANYIYFDLIVSYLIILTTKFVKLPILWSQISPCRPRKQILLNVFLGLSGRCHHASAKASSSTPPDIYPPPRTKIWKSVSDSAHPKILQYMAILYLFNLLSVGWNCCVLLPNLPQKCSTVDFKMSRGGSHIYRWSLDTPGVSLAIPPKQKSYSALYGYILLN